jgi:radical SAM superfamily enzyme YgiQ (UPF0313 family)
MNGLKICAYVVGAQAKQNYKSESFNTRLFAGLSVVIDILRRKGYQVDFAGKATVHNYDVVLVSITSDCDWWPFIAELIKWQKGNYKVIVGGAGVLNVRPFLPFVDYFVLGRAEGVVDSLINAIANNIAFEHRSLIESAKFNINNNYYLNQVNEIYPYEIKLENGDLYHEDIIGCNHRCLFCGYTWHRKNINQGAFKYSGLWNGGVDRERAIIDIANGERVDFNKLRTTAIDGLSQRLRFMVNKKITRDMLQDFLFKLAKCDKPHQVKFYNIVGYPTETAEDWREFLEDIIKVDKRLSKTDKQTSILLHSTPFRAMPATPLACKEMSYKNYRGEIARVLGGRKYKGNIFYQGNSIWAVESMATESLSTVIQSAIIWRGTEKDAKNIIRISCSNKFNTASAMVKQATLEKYFDVKTLFGKFTAETLPTKYLKTYANIEKMW